MQLIDFLDKGAERHPHRPLLVDEPRSWTYAEIATLTHRIANALHAQGVGRDCHFATYSPNHAMAFAAQYGGLRAGGTWIPTNTRNGIDENIDILAALETEWLFFHSDYESMVQRILQAVPGIRGAVCVDRASDFAPSLDDFIQGTEDRAPVVDKGPLGLAALFSTGGTTGRPKGVELTHLNWASMIINMQAAMPVETPPVHLVVAPMTHAAGALAAATLSQGGTQVLLPKAEPEAILRAIEQHRVTVMFMPPTLIYMLLACPSLGGHDYRSLKYFLYGAAPMSVQKLREAIAAFGPVLCQVYGQTEALMVGTFFSAAEHIEALQNPGLQGRLASAGRAYPYTMVEVMDDAGLL